MCNVCGCGHGETRVDGERHDHDGLAGHAHEHAHDHGHSHDHHHHHDHDHESGLHFGKGPAHAHAPGFSQARLVRIEQDILAKNDRYAVDNRTWFADNGTLAVNLVSSPGSGKTSLLQVSLDALAGALPLAVIEGDQQTDNDAARIRETGVPAVQINTGKGCHLDAHMVGHALERIGPVEHGIVFIENVGNLVCPAGFDLGERHKVVILSVTEGEDKPLKYPDMFAASDLMLLTKVDLLPYLDFDVERCIEYARRVNPDIQVLQVSSKSGEGMEDWLAWLRARVSSKTAPAAALADGVGQA